MSLGIVTVLGKLIIASRLYEGIMATLKENKITAAAKTLETNKVTDVPDLIGLRILLVEGNKINRLLAADLVKKTKAGIIIAKNG